MLTAAAVATATLLLSATITNVQGGNCWSGMTRNGRCTDLIQEKVTREQCCALAVGSSASVSTAWSEKDMDAGMLFFWRVLGGGVPCQPCRDICSDVTCGPGRRCAVRWGRPQCVCAPDCSRKRLAALYPLGPGADAHPRGPVCGSDGRSYRSTCRLLKRACRRKNSNLVVAYHGTCQSSCDRVHCGAGRSCVQDQNLSPHCVRCERHCPSAARVSAGRAVCGADGTTYPSTCHLRETACRAGKAIPVAYRGRCQRVASCGAVQCRRHQSCLTDLTAGTPRCVTCSLHCPRASTPSGPQRSHGRGGKGAQGAGPTGRQSGFARRLGAAPSGASGGSGKASGVRSAGARIRELLSLDTAAELVRGGLVCGSNNRTYSSWCHMRKDACATGYVIDTLHTGPCVAQPPSVGEEASPHLNAVLDEHDDTFP